MKIIKLDKTLIDGRFMKYHRPTESIFNANNTMTVKLGSWPDFSSIFGPPEAISDIVMNVIDQKDIMEYIVTLPGWEGSTIIDNSIPETANELILSPEQLESIQKLIQSRAT